jgi:signal transduction histidine kinase
MDTESALDDETIAAGLTDPDWTRVLDTVVRAGQSLADASATDRHGMEAVVAQLAAVANHPKWEIRRAVANAAAQLRHPAFERVLQKLATDDNARVREAAERASLRRRDSRHASALGKQHEERINSSLDGIEARFGTRGREAVKRVAAQMADTFARELYHEVIRLVSPLAMSADRLRAQLTADIRQSPELLNEVARIERHIAHLRSVLHAMRAYTAQPVLVFSSERLCELVQEGATFAFADMGRATPAIENHVPPTIVADVARSRLVQALTNVLRNAVEAYGPDLSSGPITVNAETHEGSITLSIRDSGCGMSAESLADAGSLFATNKPNGTGFGLPLAIKIVDSEHGGRLRIESTKGVGTTVRIVIPIHQKPTAG